MRRTITFLLFFLLSGITIAFAQSINVKGNVTDNSGAGLPGVTVKAKGSATGTVTDINGNYSISVSANGTLSFSYIGFTAKDVAVANQSKINVVLDASSTGLDEVIVVGYGTQKKAVVTGAIASVTAADLKDQQITRIDDALQGRAAGVFVVQSSGAPGAGPSIAIRGSNSLSNNSPLYVIDGVVWDNGGYDLVNPNDVESIDVLKDASAAIYGSRASNGVILITTKKGKAGKPKVSYDAYYGTQSVIKKLALANASQYAALRNQSKTNDGGTAPFADPSVYGVGTNWQDQIFNSAPIQSHTLAVSGGGETSTYYTSLGYLDQKGIVDPNASDYKRVNIKINATFTPKKWLTFGENFTYAYARSTTFFNTNSEFGGPLSDAINIDPITPVLATNISALPNANIYNNEAAFLVRNSAGIPYGISPYVANEITNPLAAEQLINGDYNWSHNLMGDVYLQIEPIKGLKIKTEIAGKQAFYGGESFSPLYYLNSNSSNLVNTTQNRSDNQNLEWNWDNTISYNHSWGLHNLTALVGVSAEEENGRGDNISFIGEPAFTSATASFNYALPAASRIGGGFDSQPLTRDSYFGRVSYNYDEKYLFTGIIRRDGSSKFGSDRVYGTFPSASIGWIATRENFFPKNTFVDYLKVRASYGILGNELALSTFQYTPIVGSAGGGSYVVGGQLVTGFGPNTLANPLLQWERTKSADIAFDAIIFHDFTVTLDLYDKKTDDLLIQQPLPAYAGLSAAPYANAGDIENKGVELELGYNKRINKDISFGINGNLSYNNNKVVGIGILPFQNFGSFQSSAYNLQRNQPGEPQNEFYGFQTLGVFHSQAEINAYKDGAGNLIQPNAKPGDLKFADISGTGPIGPKDRTFLGNPIPNWTYGFNAHANYKQFDISVFGQGVWGNKIFQAYRRLDLATANYPAAALNAWTPSNPNSNYPRLTDADPNGNFKNPSDFYLQSGAYFRIKTLQLGWTLPNSLATKWDMNKLRIYVSSNNLATFTKYNGYDPEVAGGIERGVYPQARTLMVGLDITL